MISADRVASDLAVAVNLFPGGHLSMKDIVGLSRQRRHVMMSSTIVHAQVSARPTLRTVAVPVTAPGSLLTPVSSQATTNTTATMVTCWQLSGTVRDRWGARARWRCSLSGE